MSGPAVVCSILRPHVSRAEIEAALAGLGYAHLETYPGDGDRVAEEQVWVWPTAAATTAAVNYLEDPLSNLRYLLIRGAGRPDAVPRLAERLALYARDELLDDALHATAHDDQVRAINRLAIGYVEFDWAVFGIIATFATRAETPLLREAAVNATGFRAWPQFRPMLEVLVRSDPADNVRSRAALLLAHWPPVAQTSG